MRASRPISQGSTAKKAPISVAVLTYNSERTISDCLQSLGEQDLRPAEVLVVDDDSTDRTLELVERLARTFPFPIRVLRNGSHNISKGRNIAIEHASHSRVAFLDSDAYADRAWLDALNRCFDSEPRPAVIGGSVNLAHATPFAEALSINDETVRAFFTRGTLLVNGCNMALDRDLIGNALFDPEFIHAEDIEFLDRACVSYPWKLAEDASVDHESRTTPRTYIRQMYKYGAWKVRYAVKTGHHRFVDYVPSVSLIVGILAAPFWPPALLAFPALCLAETLFVMAYRRVPLRMAGLLLLGWTVKNTGWGLGVIAATPSAIRMTLLSDRHRS